MAIRRPGMEELLVGEGVESGALRDARKESERSGVGLVEATLRQEGVSPLAVARAVSRMLGLPLLEKLELDQIELELIRPLSLAMAREEGILPLWEDKGIVRVGISESKAMERMEDLRVLYRRPVRPVVVPADALREITNKAFDKAARSASAVMEEIEDEQREDADEGSLSLDADLLDDPNQAPIIKFVNTLLSQAVKDRASDIHIEPFERELVVRFRIDGVLYEVVKPPARLQASIVSRVKIMSGLNIAEKRIPQDGRIKTRIAGREVDLRVSTLPVRHGERVVMRILEKGRVFNLDQIGMSTENVAQLRELIQRPHGIMLVTGPTGSGKTTTLYSGLAEVNAPDINILTIEDPIEYELKGIGQTQVNPKIDLTFASALRAHLRQDPDVIMVGEIRDKETAENAVQASLTGHLVFSTLHTNDAAGAFTRLIDMGVQPFLVSSSLLAVLAQRLVRRLCPLCKEAYTPTDLEIKEVSLARSRITGPIYRAKGCPTCLQTGYKGRVGIYELLMMSDAVRQLVMANTPSGIIKRKAAEEGMHTLRMDGVRQVLAGVTSIDEVMRVTQEDFEEV